MVSQEKMDEFVRLLDRHTVADGAKQTALDELVTFRATQDQKDRPIVYEAAIIILGQGEKYCRIGGNTYDYSAGNYLTLFLPMPIVADIVNVSPDKPCLMAAIKIDLKKIAALLLKINQVEGQGASSKAANNSGIVVKPLDDDLLDPVVRLLRTLDSPLDQHVLSESILQEIYYRLILRSDHSGSLRQLLQQRGSIQLVARAVDYIHHHLDKPVSVEQLASLSSMSVSSFHRVFREVMHMPPLKYAKAIKLNHAQILISNGKSTGEAGRLVGYQSSAQFSREYKRLFGYAPSETRQMMLLNERQNQ